MVANVAHASQNDSFKMATRRGRIPDAAMNDDVSREEWQRRADEANAAVVRWGPAAPQAQTRMLRQCLRRALLAVSVHDALRSTAKVPRDLETAIRALLAHESRAWTVDFDWWGREGRCCAWSAVSRQPPSVLDTANLAALEARAIKQIAGGRRRRHKHHRRSRRRRTRSNDNGGGLIASEVRATAEECGRTANLLRASWEGLKRYASSSAGMDVHRCMQQGTCSTIASRVARLTSRRIQ
jgi:hypothetical protein